MRRESTSSSKCWRPCPIQIGPQTTRSGKLRGGGRVEDVSLNYDDDTIWFSEKPEGTSKDSARWGKQVLNISAGKVSLSLSRGITPISCTAILCIFVHLSLALLQPQARQVSDFGHTSIPEGRCVGLGAGEAEHMLCTSYVGLWRWVPNGDPHEGGSSCPQQLSQLRRVSRAGTSPTLRTPPHTHPRLSNPNSSSPPYCSCLECRAQSGRVIDLVTAQSTAACSSRDKNIEDEFLSRSHFRDEIRPKSEWPGTSGAMDHYGDSMVKAKLHAKGLVQDIAALSRCEHNIIPGPTSSFGMFTGHWLYTAAVPRMIQRVYVLSCTRKRV